jgi:putative YhbY family RNA-binding protein
MEDLRELRKKAVFLEPVARIGKNGLTKGVSEEIKMHLKKKKLIKVKVLKSALTENNELKKETLKEFGIFLAQNTGSELVQAIGLNVVLKYIEGKSKQKIK